MELSIGLLLLYAVVAVHSKGNDVTTAAPESIVRLPPSIIRQNEKLTSYLGIDAKLLLVCDADGYPEPEYEWYKDGAVWNPKPGDVQSTPGSGNRTIPSFSYTHAGMFQCFAFNKYGKTMTQKITIEVAVIAKFQPKDTDSITKNEGDNMKLLCNAPKSMPSPTLSWKPVESLAQNAAQMNIELTRRVQIDDEGNLVFAHVMTDDHIDNWLYRCVAENAIAGLSAFGSYAQLNVKPSPGRTIKPAIQSYTGNQGDKVVALKHGTISLRCLFSGKPEPQVTWKRVDNKPLMGDRTDYEQFQTVLIINDVQDYDEAVYRCTGTNSEGSSSHDIALTVEAVPEFVGGKQPKNLNATDGDEVVFPCDAVAEPKGDIIWYKNSEEITVSNIPARVSIDGDRKNLRIADVCKDCRSGGTDLSVYGCEAVNEHGSNFSSGYLNVLLPTVMTLAPKNYKLDFKNDQITFTCEGATDDSTPLKTMWLQDNLRFEDIPNEFYSKDTDSGSILFIITKNLPEKGKEYLGNYTCILFNGYSSTNATAALLEVIGAVPVTTTNVGDWWWVFLIVGILLLLLLLLLCCCICLQKNKGDTYPVDEKERANGNDPEKELADSGYHDYQRPEEEPVKGSRASLNSAMKLDDSDDDASLAEYGDIDTGKFNEDGSFIGLYNTADRRRDTNV